MEECVYHLFKVSIRLVLKFKLVYYTNKMSSIEMTPEVCIDLLKRYVDIGYKNASLTIKEGATLHKYFRILKKQENPENIKDSDIYRTLFKVLDSFNARGSYSLDDSAVIDRVITFIQENMSKESLASEPKKSEIKEI